MDPQHTYCFATGEAPPQRKKKSFVEKAKGAWGRLWKKNPAPAAQQPAPEAQPQPSAPPAPLRRQNAQRRLPPPQPSAPPAPLRRQNAQRRLQVDEDVDNASAQGGDATARVRRRDVG